MSKSNKTESNERSEMPAITPTPQTKRYDEALKRQAVENWLKTGISGSYTGQT